MADPARKTNRHYTYGDYRKWPDDERWELIDGVAWNMSPVPARRHQRAVAVIFNTFYNALRSGPCEIYVSPFDVLLPDAPGMADDDVGTVVQPDVLVFCDRSRLTDAGATGAPTLLVEVLSPSTASKDIRIKRDLYERHRVAEYWIVDPGNRFIEVWLLDEQGHYPDEPKMYQHGRHKSLSPSVPELADAAVTIDLRELFTD